MVRHQPPIITDERILLYTRPMTGWRSASRGCLIPGRPGIHGPESIGRLHQNYSLSYSPDKKRLQMRRCSIKKPIGDYIHTYIKRARIAIFGFSSNLFTLNSDKALFMDRIDYIRIIPCHIHPMRKHLQMRRCSIKAIDDIIFIHILRGQE